MPIYTVTVELPTHKVVTPTEAAALVAVRDMLVEVYGPTAAEDANVTVHDVKGE